MMQPPESFLMLPFCLLLGHSPYLSCQILGFSYALLLRKAKIGEAAVGVSGEEDDAASGDIVV